MKASEETEMYLREQYRIYLQKVSNANRSIAEKIEEDEQMQPVWMDVFKKEIDEHDLIKLFGYVLKGGMALDFAVTESGLSEDDFQKGLKKYKASLAATSEETAKTMQPV